MSVRRGRRLTWLLAWASLTGCLSFGNFECGLRTVTGGSCNPFSTSDQCPVGDFCSRVELCTHACTVDFECRTRCSVDDAGVARGCPLGDRCREGTCSSDLGARCVEGICQPPCTAFLSDGGCDWDVYGPSDYAREK